jgi:HEAT repeat protein
MASWNPYIRRQWQEDEAYRPTFYTRMDNLQQLRSGAGRLDLAEQERLSREMIELVKDDPNPLIRRKAIRVLSAFRGPTAVEGLRAATGDADSQVRIAAIHAWRDRGDDEAVRVLANLVGSDMDQNVRMAAARGLAAFRDPRAAEALAIALEDRDPALQYTAMQSLRLSTGRDYGNDMGLWQAYLRGENPPEPERSFFAERLFRWF